MSCSPSIIIAFLYDNRRKIHLDVLKPKVRITGGIGAFTRFEDHKRKRFRKEVLASTKGIFGKHMVDRSCNSQCIICLIITRYENLGRARYRLLRWRTMK